MPLFITLSRGARTDLASPVLATGDRQVVGAVLQTLARLDEWDNDPLAGCVATQGGAVRAPVNRWVAGWETAVPDGDE